MTEKVIEAFFNVYNTLGYGFAEKVYQNALVMELVALGLTVESQKQITVRYSASQLPQGNAYRGRLVAELWPQGGTQTQSLRQRSKRLTILDSSR
ncbi:MAG: GxxExxY protein, partial [Anaerolineae bacterium]|nr:GxxExxY protein [Anaerolineae bacterium]